MTRRIEPPSSGIATSRPFCAGVRWNACARNTPSAPISVQTMKLVSKYKREHNKVGQCPARLNSPRFIVSPPSTVLLDQSLEIQFCPPRLCRADRETQP